MSEPKRYQPVVQCVEPSYQAQMIEPKVMEFSEGEYVLHSDYARLKSEVERLKSEVAGLSAQLVELDDLKAENARMTKDEAYYEMRHKELIADKLRLGHQVRELADKLRKEG